MKTIAIFAGYISPHLGGIERYVDNITSNFIKLGHKVIIVTMNYSDLPEMQTINGVEIIRIPVFNIFKERYAIPKYNKKQRNLIKKLDSYNIDYIIVNTRFHLTSHIGARYGKKHNIPVYLIDHSSGYVSVGSKFWDFIANRYEDFLTWKIKKKIKGFYGVSDACGKWLKNFKVDVSGTWYNSIDCNQNLPKKEKHETINFLYAGRIIREKGVENILISFVNLSTKYENMKLFIAGDGSELEKYKRTYNQNNIYFLGRLNFNDLLKYYAKTDIFLYPPFYPEGLPTSILEAGLMKLAVICTDRGGTREVITNGVNGIIVDDGQAPLEKAMEKLINKADLRHEYAEKLNEVVKNNFSWEATCKKIINDMEEVRDE